MKKLSLLANDYINKIKSSVIDDIKRCEIMFLWLNWALAIVSFVMSIVNIFTAEYTLMTSTLLFCILCFLNTFLVKTKIKNQYIYIIFATESILLLDFFLISGIPNGFSALWVCLIPSFSLLVFGRKRGSIFCITTLLMLIFLFWTPFGKDILMYHYSDTFLLRFPFLYIATFIISLIVEYVRSETNRQLLYAKKRYEYLYRHDALTGLYNRYGFNECMENIFTKSQDRPIALMIMDIDNFKNVNDKYGHEAGDAVLKKFSDLLKELVCCDCTYCRWGGEEFTILMQCKHSPYEMAEKIRKTVEKSPVIYNGKSIFVTISIGICIADNMVGTTREYLINQADKCLYKAKQKGKNQVVSTTIN